MVKFSKPLDQAIELNEPQYWANPNYGRTAAAFQNVPTSRKAVDQAQRDWKRFGPLLEKLFPELEATGGEITSPLNKFPNRAAKPAGAGAVLVKSDHQLPVTGTIKARGGVFEVLRHAEQLALEAGVIEPDASSADLASEKLRLFFSRHHIVTGSTGNLGFSVGLTASALGFSVQIHMSSEAKPWKVERLRALGVDVVQHPGDFSYAVGLARDAAQVRPDTYFVDDEDSLTLFLGYSSAAFELKQQLDGMGIAISAERPLMVYLPCGVGGSPGGIAFGLKHLFGDAVHCIFAEPVSAPAVMLQVAMGLEHPVSVYDYGLDNKTIADGLAVSSASHLVVRHVRELVCGFASVGDSSLLAWTSTLWQAGGLRLEPSAAAGFEALRLTATSPTRPSDFENAVHVVWTTGGAQLPDHEFDRILSMAAAAGSVADIPGEVS